MSGLVGGVLIDFEELSELKLQVKAQSKKYQETEDKDYFILTYFAH